VYCPPPPQCYRVDIFDSWGNYLYSERRCQ
jgi:hypothetical protein